MPIPPPDTLAALAGYALEVFRLIGEIPPAEFKGTFMSATAGGLTGAIVALALNSASPPPPPSPQPVVLSRPPVKRRTGQGRALTRRESKR